MTKSIFIFLLGILFIEAAIAQKSASVYYLKKSGVLVSTRDSADFFLVILPPDTNLDKNLFIVKEFYPNGKLRYVSSTKVNKLQVIDPKYPNFYKPVLEGACISFFPDGHKMKVENYENGEAVGDETAYYPNGKIYYSKTYTKDKKLLCIECRDTTGKVLAENGSGKWINFIDERFKNYVGGEVSNGLEQGEWHGKQDDSLNIVWNYKNGDLKSAYILDKSGGKIYTNVEIVPEFPGGLDAFGRFLAHKVRYPAVAFEKHIQGRVIVSFIVEQDGKLSNIKIARGIGGGCDEETMRVIKLSPPWKPGLSDGQPVRVAYSVPIGFTMSD